MTSIPKKRVGKYSGGMKRRLDLALALVHDPLVLFLDEPTTGLDPASRTSASGKRSAASTREKGVTIFLTTQYLEEADKLADEVAIIDRGRIVAQGAPRALKKAIGNEVVTLSFASEEVAQRAASVLERLLPRPAPCRPRSAVLLRHGGPTAPRADTGAGRSRRALWRGSRSASRASTTSSCRPPVTE